MSSEVQETEETIKVDGVDHLVSELSDDAKSLLSTYKAWNADLNEADTRVLQLKLSIEALTNRIVHQIKEDQPKTVVGGDETGAEDSAK